MCVHSMEDLNLELNSVGRAAAILSQRINRKNNTAIKEMSDPIEEIEFQAVYASG